VETATVMLALMLVGNLIDNIPNASLTPLTWLLAGALWGRLELGHAHANANADTDAQAQDARSAGGGSRIRRGDNVSEVPVMPRNRAAYTRQNQKIERVRRT